MSHLELDTGITRFYRTDLYVLPPPIQMLGRRKLHLTPLRCDANTKIRVLKNIFLITFWNASSRCCLRYGVSSRKDEDGAAGSH